jgi:hypothetical protein
MHQSVVRRIQPDRRLRPRLVRTRAQVVRLHPPRRASKVYGDGLLAGFAGGAAFAISALAIAIASRPVDPVEPVLDVVWLHGLLFLLAGFAASRLLALVEHHPHLGFGVVVVFVVLAGAYLAGTMLVSSGSRPGMGWEGMIGADLPAMAAMTVVLWRRGSGVAIRP